MTVLFSPNPGPPTSITKGGESKVNLSGAAAWAVKGMKSVKVRAITNDKAADFFIEL